MKLDNEKSLSSRTLHLLAALNTFRAENNLTDFHKALQQSWLFASDEVIQLCYAYVNAMTAVKIVAIHIKPKGHTEPDINKTKDELGRRAFRLDGLISLAMRQHIRGGANWMSCGFVANINHLLGQIQRRSV